MSETKPKLNARNLVFILLLALAFGCMDVKPRYTESSYSIDKYVSDIDGSVAYLTCLIHSDETEDVKYYAFMKVEPHGYSDNVIFLSEGNLTLLEDACLIIDEVGEIRETIFIGNGSIEDVVSDLNYTSLSVNQLK
ncbi:hypothetical protein [Cerasicoccus frondis]|uniref:hypothetical protein n=1 Tax=Cerasicoccus frondis TaxID=490090 RepID=UPI002852BB55|nr:hypothetical protein [Cerasicoccus frondis]